jgi:hypothetical protein
VLGPRTDEQPLPPTSAVGYLRLAGTRDPASLVEVDGAAIIEAAADAAVTLWPYDPYCGSDC